MQHLQPNTTLQGGKYKIERVLGQGGFGITYLAKYTSNGRKVAIKELFVNQEGLAINDRNGNEVVVTSSMNQELFNALRAKFKKEALRLTHFNHPNLVKVNEYFEENGTAYYTMQYIEGESLKKKLNREGAMSETLVLDYARQVLSALEVVHREKIWHLDIKPDNIMVDGNDNVYLIDFGASKHIEKSGILTTSLDLTYTPAYCAPEMKDLSMVTPEERSEALKEIGAWTDLYSLGATMYNLLTESIPPSSVRINKVGRNAFMFPIGVSSSTKNLIVKMMTPNKDDRPKSASTVVRILDKEEEKKDVTIVEKPRAIVTRTPVKEENGEKNTNDSYMKLIGCIFLFNGCIMAIAGIFEHGSENFAINEGKELLGWFFAIIFIALGYLCIAKFSK